MSPRIPLILFIVGAVMAGIGLMLGPMIAYKDITLMVKLDNGGRIVDVACYEGKGKAMSILRSYGPEGRLEYSLELIIKSPELKKAMKIDLPVSANSENYVNIKLPQGLTYQVVVRSYAIYGGSISKVDEKVLEVKA